MVCTGQIKNFLCYLWRFLIILGFGWSKPVPINSNNFRNVRIGEVLVSLSGIITNFILFIIFLFCYVLCMLYLDSTVFFYEFLQMMFFYLASTNLFFAVFNLLPLYPLDGFNFIRAFCRYDNKFIQFMYKWSFLIMLVLLLTGALGWLLGNFANVVINGFLSLFTHMLI